MWVSKFKNIGFFYHFPKFKMPFLFLFSTFFVNLHIINNIYKTAIFFKIKLFFLPYS